MNTILKIPPIIKQGIYITLIRKIDYRKAKSSLVLKAIGYPTKYETISVHKLNYIVLIYSTQYLNNIGSILNVKKYL